MTTVMRSDSWTCRQVMTVNAANEARATPHVVDVNDAATCMARKFRRRPSGPSCRARDPVVSMIHVHGMAGSNLCPRGWRGFRSLSLASTLRPPRSAHGDESPNIRKRWSLAREAGAQGHRRDRVVSPFDVRPRAGSEPLAGHQRSAGKTCLPRVPSLSRVELVFL
jgi:hypothetical protein